MTSQRNSKLNGLHKNAGNFAIVTSVMPWDFGSVLNVTHRKWMAICVLPTRRRL
jgi:hypothetical protein